MDKGGEGPGLGPGLGGRCRVWLCPLSLDKGTGTMPGAGLRLLGGRDAFFSICLRVSEGASGGPGELSESKPVLALPPLLCRGCWG